MPMRITFDLSDSDLRALRKRMSAYRASASAHSEEKIAREARRLLTSADVASTPLFIRDRIRRLGTLLDMLEDEQFDITGADRKRIVQALAYFAEPHDVIPDAVPGLGYLDDAILAELVVREMEHEVDAYEDFALFCKRELAGRRGVSRAQHIQTRRRQLHQRMRRRRRKRPKH